jgi:hypothetical protein
MRPVGMNNGMRENALVLFVVTDVIGNKHKPQFEIIVVESHVGNNCSCCYNDNCYHKLFLMT